ncbi:hypothetical protein ACQI4L_27450 [Mycolicibacterium litorale]|uniref:hypothetical protein n=1 Tax=Mycolicibacterium litorale TaxID=758802 RepID=UPI003CF82617
MPGDDLLRFIGGPLPPSWWWIALTAVIVAAAGAWVSGVLVWTMPVARLRSLPGVRGVHSRLIRRRFARAVAVTSQAHRDRTISAEQAVAQYSRTLRTFLSMRTGVNAKSLHLGDLADGELARAVPLLRAFHDAQFNGDSRLDVTALGRSAEELIRTWS